MTDMVEVIRCRDCKYFREANLEKLGIKSPVYYCRRLGFLFGDGPFPDDYCCWAERRDAE